MGSQQYIPPETDEERAARRARREAEAKSRLDLSVGQLSAGAFKRRQQRPRG